MNTVLKLPFNKKKDFNIDLHHIKNTLDKEIYGNETIKRNILQYFAKKKSNPNSKGEILALCGSPGVGKTKIIRDGLANAINLPFFQINCGGLNDVSIISGHSSTYVGSKPGKIVDILIESQCSNPIIYIDELDKISDHKKKEIYGILTHIFDEQQNKEFQDNYVGNLNINLSNIFFVVSFNNQKAIDPILLDRFKIINVPNPSHDDKIEICKKMFIEIKNEIWNENQNVTIDCENEFFDYLISNYHCNDIGVRQLKKSIYTILENINLDFQLNNNDFNNININTSHINKYLVKNKESKDYLHMYL
jgi:ATP-dependent Lon protease